MNKRPLITRTLAARLLLLAAGLSFAIFHEYGAASASKTTKGARRSGVARPQTPALAAGQSATLLPDGRWLLLGGRGADGQPSAAAAVADGGGNVVAPRRGMRAARAGHSATVLPDGRVLVFGGIGVEGRVLDSAELFEPTTQTFTALARTGLTPRAEHTATLLTDGSVLIVGGVAVEGGAPLSTMESWEPSLGVGSALPSSLLVARRAHAAELLADATLQFWGGAVAEGSAPDSGERYDPVTGDSHWLNSPLASDAMPYLSGSLPANNATDVAVSASLAVRFSRPLRVTTVNAETVTLVGPEGRAEARVVPAEGGRLAFVRPLASLAPGVTYTLSLAGATDAEGNSLLPATVTFATAGAPAQDHAGPANAEPQRSPDHANHMRGDAARAVAAEEWVPDADSLRGDWRSKRPHRAHAQKEKPLRAAAGMTALSGQVLTLADEPLSNVTLRIGDAVARTDHTGRFLLTGLSAGRHSLIIDGNTASTPAKPYASFEALVEVVAGQTNVLPYTIWLPIIDTQNGTELESPTARQVRAVSPRIPGLEVHIPAGVRLRYPGGRLFDKLTITALPADRPPFPGPATVGGVMFTLQMHGARVEPVNGAVQRGLRIVFPNLVGAAPGARLDLWSYETARGGWHVYGQGVVSADGRKVVPERQVALNSMHCNFFLGGPGAPPEGPPPGSDAADGDPVDLSTGLFIYEKTDLVLNDTIPATLTRTYRQKDNNVRPFGIGATHPYAIYLTNAYPDSYITSSAVLLPDGSKINYVRNAAGVLEHTETPTSFYRSTLIPGANNSWDVKLQDGTVYHFYRKGRSYSAFSHEAWLGLEWIQDRNGNRLVVTSDDNYRVNRVTTTNGRWLAFSYDSNKRVTQIEDNTGRKVKYEYDAAGRLWKATDPAGGVTEYTYDASHRMLTIKDARGIIFLTNEYDANGRVKKQTLADGSTYQFAYTLDSYSKVTQTDVTDQRGNVRRVTFNTAGYPLTDARAVGKPEQQTVSLERQPTGNLVTRATDAAGRVTEYAYDPAGNLTEARRFPGTPGELKAVYTYNPSFGKVQTATIDPAGLNQTTTFAYDSKGNVTSVTDALNHQTSFGYNAAGQLTSVTSPLQQTTQFHYDAGDLIGVTDPLGRHAGRYVDGAGRVARVINPLGHTTRYEYDVLNQVRKITDPAQGATEFTYDPNGNLLSVKDARGKVTSYTYDSMDRVATRNDPLSKAESYAYDERGNLKKFTDRRGKVTTYAYDSLDRVKFAGFGTAGEGESVTYESTIGYSYDAANRPLQVVDSASGAIMRSYDDAARTFSETTPQGAVSYGYDAAGRRVSMTVAGQPAVSYSYDAADRLTGITQGAAGVAIGYDAANRRTSLTLPNGAVVEYGYDAASQLTAMVYKLGGAVIGDLTYGYDSAGRRVSVGGSFARTNLPQPLASAGYNDNNQLVQRGGAALAYDDNGNLTSDGVNSYVWDARNRLASISGGVTASFQYDAFGRRVGKTANGQSVGYLYDGVGVVQELTGGAPSANLLVGGVDEVFSRTDAAGARTLLADGLGSTLALLDSAGVAQTQYTYDPFGAVTQSGAASGNSSQYTGRENDGTGLYYYRARYYSPALQRFISEDPVGLAGGANFYAYALNSPVSLRDPMGTIPEWATRWTNVNNGGWSTRDSAAEFAFWHLNNALQNGMPQPPGGGEAANSIDVAAELYKTLPTVGERNAKYYDALRCAQGDCTERKNPRWTDGLGPWTDDGFSGGYNGGNGIDGGIGHGCTDCGGGAGGSSPGGPGGGGGGGFPGGSPGAGGGSGGGGVNGSGPGGGNRRLSGRK